MTRVEEYLHWYERGCRPNLKTPSNSLVDVLKDYDHFVEEYEAKNKTLSIDVYSFEAFWNLYDKKTGQKKCLVKWSKISQKDKDLIFVHLPKYKASKPDKQFRLNPLTYLNGEHWHDEIIVSTTVKQPNKLQQTIDIITSLRQ